MFVLAYKNCSSQKEKLIQAEANDSFIVEEREKLFDLFDAFYLIFGARRRYSFDPFLNVKLVVGVVENFKYFGDLNDNKRVLPCL